MDLIDALEILAVKNKWERIADGDALESDMVNVEAQKWYMMEKVFKSKRRI